MHINGLAWTEAETNFATATWDAGRCLNWVNLCRLRISAARLLYP
jgi:hypothetical protein